MPYKKILKVIIFFSFIHNYGQKAIELSEPEYIKTVLFSQNGTNFNGTPLIQLGSRFTVSFDDIMGDEAFYYYKISYYNFDWSASTISKNEYLDGIDNLRITETKNSLNTLQIFTHYQLSLPNQNLRQLKISGNYLFELYNNNEELVFSKKFIIYEKGTTVQAEIKRSRNLTYINQKQIVQFSINANQPIIAPDKNLKTLIIQNENLETSITNLKPQYSFGQKFIYKYDQEASFWAGNEYWNFDNKEIRNSTINISHIELKDIYHNHLYAHPYRALKTYTYFPDINGNFVIRNISANDNDIEAEYAWIHFTLNIQPISNKEVHIYGGFNNFRTDESTLMTYNKKTKQYQGKRLFKQGFYNFKYVTKDNKNNTLDTGEISGNFDKTENEYTILVYYRSPSNRYDRIIGIGTANSRIITN